MIENERLQLLKELSDRADPPPWKAMWEGRDHLSGDSFVQVGDDDDRGEDLYVVRDSGPGSLAVLELIAEARNALPLLIEEIERLRAILDSRAGQDG